MLHFTWYEPSQITLRGSDFLALTQDPASGRAVALVRPARRYVLHRSVGPIRFPMDLPPMLAGFGSDGWITDIAPLDANGVPRRLTLGNVAENGHICWGGVDRSSTNDPEACLGLFFDAPFSHHWMDRETAGVVRGQTPYGVWQRRRSRVARAWSRDYGVRAPSQGSLYTCPRQEGWGDVVALYPDPRWSAWRAMANMVSVMRFQHKRGDKPLTPAKAAILKTAIRVYDDLVTPGFVRPWRVPHAFPMGDNAAGTLDLLRAALVTEAENPKDAHMAEWEANNPPPAEVPATKAEAFQALLDGGWLQSAAPLTATSPLRGALASLLHGNVVPVKPGTMVLTWYDRNAVPGRRNVYLGVKQPDEPRWTVLHDGKSFEADDITWQPVAGGVAVDVKEAR